MRQWACAHRAVLVPSPAKASWLNPAECHAGDIPRLALTGQQFKTVEEVGRVLDAAVPYRNLEPKQRGRTFRDTVRAERRWRAKAPVWKHASSPGKWFAAASPVAESREIQSYRTRYTVPLRRSQLIPSQMGQLYLRSGTFQTRLRERVLAARRRVAPWPHGPTGTSMGA